MPQWLMAQGPQHTLFTDMAGDILCLQYSLHSYAPFIYF